MSVATPAVEHCTSCLQPCSEVYRLKRSSYPVGHLASTTEINTTFSKFLHSQTEYLYVAEAVEAQSINPILAERGEIRGDVVSIRPIYSMKHATSNLWMPLSIEA